MAHIRNKIKIPTSKLLRASVKGQVMIFVSILVGTGVLMGLVALAVDGGSALLQRRVMQNAADAAALGSARLLADSVVWGPTAPGNGPNGPIYIATDAQLKNLISQLTQANGIVSSLGYGVTLEYGKCVLVNGSCSYDWTAVSGAVNINGTWSPPPDPALTSTVPADADAVRIRTTRNNPTTFARLVGINSIQVSAVSAAALIGDANHIISGPTWPMVTEMTTGTINQYLTNAYGLCNPSTFYNQGPTAGNTRFQNLVSLAWAQGCSFTKTHNCSSVSPPNGTQDGLHSQLIAWGDQRGDPDVLPGQLDDNAHLWGGRPFSSICSALAWGSKWNPLGSCSGTTNTDWTIYGAYGTLCCRGAGSWDVSDIDVPNWIYWDFAGNSRISSQESAFLGGTSLPGETRWTDLADLNGPRQDYRNNNWPPDDELQGDWLETYDSQSLVGQNPNMVIGPVLDYIERNGTMDALGSPQGLNYGKHVDKVMYLYKEKEVSQEANPPDPQYCNYNPPPDPPDCSNVWQPTSIDNQHPDRVHIVQPLKFRFYAAMAQDVQNWTIPLHPSCPASQSNPNPGAAVLAIIVGEQLDRLSDPNLKAPHSLYNYVTFIDPN